MVAIRERIESVQTQAADHAHVALHGELLSIVDDLADRHMAKPELARGLLENLRNVRAFDRLHIAASAMAVRGLVSPFSNRMKVQALAELGRHADALREIEAARAAYPDDKGEQIELMGLEGRLYKQLFVQSVAAGTPENTALKSAISAYDSGWVLSGRHATWLGVNLVALLHRAATDGLDVRASYDVEKLARHVLQAAQDEKDSDPDSPWSDASMGEVALALGQFDKALEGYKAFVDHQEVDAFSVASAHRQLVEIWRCHDPAANDQMRLLSDQMTGVLMRLPNGQLEFGSGELSGVARRLETCQSEDGYEGLWGSHPVPLQWAKRMVEIGNCIGRVERRGGFGEAAGTGFVIDAALLSPTWSEYGHVFVTNEHVASAFGRTRLKPEDVAVRFSQAEPNQAINVGSVLWCSEREHHDVTIFRMNGLPDSIGSFSEVAPLSCLGEDGKNSFSGVTVIGHPAGSERLHLGVENLDVEDLETNRPGGVPERVWYKCPTLKGNSGSPALSWKQLQLTAVHHREIKARGCNEGVSLDSIRKAIEQQPDGWPR